MCPLPSSRVLHGTWPAAYSISSEVHVEGSTRVLHRGPREGADGVAHSMWRRISLCDPFETVIATPKLDRIMNVHQLSALNLYMASPTPTHGRCNCHPTLSQLLVCREFSFASESWDFIFPTSTAKLPCLNPAISSLSGSQLLGCLGEVGLHLFDFDCQSSDPTPPRHRHGGW